MKHAPGELFTSRRASIWSSMARTSFIPRPVPLGILADQLLLAPNRIGTDGAGTYPPAIIESREAGLLPRAPFHYVTSRLQHGVESDRFRVKRPMPRVGGFRSFNTPSEPPRASRPSYGCARASALPMRGPSESKAAC